MNNGHSKTRRSFGIKPCGESLESRALLTGNAGNLFAIIPGEITTTGGTQTITVHLDPTHFTIPKQGLTLGIDVAGVNGSTINPKILSVTQAPDTVATQGAHGHAHLPAGKVQIQRVSHNQAILAPVHLDAAHPQGSMSYTVKIQATAKTSGKYLLGFYLPGDADGNGKVDSSDLNTISQAIGAISGDKNYTTDIDSNRDGRIGLNDLKVAQRNLGAATTITPVISANLDPNATAGGSGRVTNQSHVGFTGTASPGATILFSDVSHKVADTSTKADGNGQYSLSVPLAVGQNTFQVTSTDAFGQTISGQINPVTYTTLPLTSLTTKASS